MQSQFLLDFGDGGARGQSFRTSARTVQDPIEMSLHIQERGSVRVTSVYSHRILKLSLSFRASLVPRIREPSINLH